MSWGKGLLGMGLLWTSAGWAQTDIHKYSLQRLSFQFTSNNLTNERCLQWLPLSEDAEHPTLEYDGQGRPFLRANLRARVEGNCRIKVENPEQLKFIGREGSVATFEARVEPPASVFVVNGPNFRDEVLVEAPIRRLNEASFLQVFKRSRATFETRYMSIKTNNPVTKKNAKVFPVVGGQFGFPIFSFFHVGFSIFQNFGNFVGAKDVDVQYSEFAFDARFLYHPFSRQKERLSLALVGDYRGRNVYQTGSVRPFIIGSVAIPGFGLDVNSYPFATASSGWSKVGIDFSTRFYMGGNVGGRPYSSYLFDTAINYKIHRKWALGFGYAYVTQSASFTGLTVAKVQERMDSFFLRLSIIPRVNNGGAQ